MARVRLWAIVGEGATGKSTIVGNLISQTGKGSGGFRYVLLRGGGYLQVYARRQSLQEAKRSPEQVLKDTQALIRKIERSRGFSIDAINLLLAIRSEYGVNNLPAGTEYLSRFVKAGWSIESLALLDYDGKKHAQYYDFGAPTCEIYNSAELLTHTANHQMVVGQVRNHFGWA